MAILLRTDIGEVLLLGGGLITADRRSRLAIPIVLLRATTEIGESIHCLRQAEADTDARYVELRGLLAGGIPSRRKGGGAGCLGDLGLCCAHLCRGETGIYLDHATRMNPIVHQIEVTGR